MRTLDVLLDKTTHTYTDSRGHRYDSVTTIISSFKEKFDPYKITKNGKTLIANYVEKHGETEEFWLAKWNKNRDDACERGTAFHQIKEDLVKYAGFLHFEANRYRVQDLESIIDRNPYINYAELPDGAYPELTIFNRRYMVSGQADLVTIDQGYVDIDDYKTNGRFDTKSFQFKGKHKMMYSPLNKFQDCHLSHYTLQLSTYAWMLEQFGLKPRRLRLLHYLLLEEDAQKVLRGEPVEHLEPTEYLLTYEKSSVEKMIKHFRTRNKTR